MNIWLSDAYLTSEAARIAHDGKNYGILPRPKRERVLIEHTQVNPTRSRTWDIYETLVSAMPWHAWKNSPAAMRRLSITTMTSGQIVSILLAEEKAFVKRKSFTTTIAWASAAYADVERRMENEEGLKKEKEEIQVKIAAQDTKKAARAETLTLEDSHETLDVLKELNIPFDLIVRESDILKGKFWEKTFELLKTKPAFYKATEGERKDCWVIKMPDAEDKIIVRSNGVPTYVGNDIANHLWKFGLLPDFHYKKLDWKTQEGPALHDRFRGR